ncbi:MAG: GntR family transcriptional regulator [Gaiellales bacterium]
MAAATEKQTRADQIRRRIRGDILSGRLLPGEKLATADLCETYDASVGVIREALTWLVSQGLVRTQAHHGHVVVPLSADDLAELTAARVLIEPVVLRLSIEQGSVDWEVRAVGAHHRLARSPREDPADPRQASEEWIAAHEAFHEALFSGCENGRLLGITAGLAQAAALYRRWSVPYEEHRDVAAEHEALLAACVGRDADRAAELLRAHISTTAELLTTVSQATPSVGS